MRRTAIAVIGALSAVPLAFLSSTPASANPGDIEAVFTTTVNPDGGNSVTGTFSAKKANQPFSCVMSDNAVSGELLLYGTSGSSQPPRPVISVTDTDVPDGKYAIEWICYMFDPETGQLVHDGTTAALAGQPGYSSPTMLEVPAVVVPEPEVPICTGSACLPTGSFGF
ncbi:hypothetical protein [Rhodococcoides fascians]|uniref:hypothetical protein n=1 Tax=Rhodococcoides fascians TaxID=1828 RepID=UPI0012FD7F0B|nr:hypothetical protein [Rhodococcus fascians]